jgi:hypothetical protein
LPVNPAYLVVIAGAAVGVLVFWDLVRMYLRDGKEDRTDDH